MPRSTFFNFFLTITSNESIEQSFLVASFRGSRATWESHTETTQEIARAAMYPCVLCHPERSVPPSLSS